MVKVEIRCPLCLKIAKIEVEENIVKTSLRGITAVKIAEFFVCEHSIIAYLDKNFVVRDCFITDFKIELPEIAINRQSGDLKGEDFFKDVDMYIVTLNLNILSMSYVLYCFFHKKKILFINEVENLTPHLMGFLDYIFENTFNFEIIIMSKDLYKKNKKEFKDHIIFDNHKIISDKNKILNPKSVKIEQIIIRKFLEENDSESGLIILKNEIYKVFHISKTIINYGEKFKQEISRKLIVDTISEEFNVKISKEYLNFLSSIITDYFGYEVVGFTNVDRLFEII